MAKIIALVIAAAAAANAGVARRGGEGAPTQGYGGNQGGSGWNDWQTSCVASTTTEYSTQYSTAYSTVYETKTVPTTVYETKTIPTTVVSTVVSTETKEVPGPTITLPGTTLPGTTITETAPCSTKWADWSAPAQASTVYVTVTSTAPCQQTTGWTDKNW